MFRKGNAFDPIEAFYVNRSAVFRGGTLLVVAIAAFGWGGIEPLNMVVVEARQGDAAAFCRMVIALFPVMLALVILCLSEKISPSFRQMCLLLSVGALMVAAVDVWFHSLDPDEPAHLFFVYEIHSGMVPYRDFFSIRHLFMHWLLSPLLGWMDGDLSIFWIVRGIMFMCMLAALAVAGRIVGWAGGRPVGVWLFLPASSLFVYGSIEFRGDPPVTVLCLLALWYLLQERPLLGGLLLGLAYLILQKAVMYGTAIALGCLLGGVAWRSVVVFISVAVVVSLAYPVWALAMGIWKDYFTCVYRCSAGFAATYIESGGLWRNHLILSLKDEFSASPLLLLAVLYGAWLLVRKGTPQRGLPWVAFISLFILFILNLGWKNYLLFAFAVLGILAAVGWSWFSPAERTLAGVAPDIVGLLVASLGLLQWAADPPPGVDLTRAEFVLQHLPRGETVYSEEHLAHPVFRRNAIYYGNSQLRYSEMFGDRGPRGDPADLTQLLKGYPPGALVIPSQARLKRALKMLEGAGIKYREAGYGVFLRVKPPLGTYNYNKRSKL